MNGFYMTMVMIGVCYTDQHSVPIDASDTYSAYNDHVHRTS